MRTYEEVIVSFEVNYPATDRIKTSNYFHNLTIISTSNDTSPYLPLAPFIFFVNIRY